jgi:hypothetical protein
MNSRTVDGKENHSEVTDTFFLEWKRRLERWFSCFGDRTEHFDVYPHRKPTNASK